MGIAKLIKQVHCIATVKKKTGKFELFRVSREELIAVIVWKF